MLVCINIFTFILEITKDNNVSTCHTVQSGSDRTSSGGIHYFQIFVLYLYHF